MLNEELLLKDNYEKELETHIRRELKLSEKRLKYRINTDVFTGDHVLEIITVISYIKKVYRQKIPVTFYVTPCAFFDKLVYIILESLFYYFYKDLKYDVKILLDPKPSIYTEGLSESPLRIMNDAKQYMRDFEWKIGRMHYRRMVTEGLFQKSDYLSGMMQEIEAFLVNTGINENVAQQMKEVLIELIGNAGEHGNTECLIDIDITDGKYLRADNDDNDTYYGMNVAILDYSPVLFYEPLKKKMLSGKELSDRYMYVREASLYHLNHLSDEYKENDFYTISSFQHKISGNFEKNEIGGTGLTSLLQSLEDQADSHLCYMLTGDRVFFFEKDQMNYDDNRFISFNKNGRYFDSIPDAELFQTINTFLPGVAYNLNYAFKKERV